MTLPQLFFAYFALSMTVLSLLIVTRKNPVHSVIWMLVLFIHIAALYLFLNAEFLAAIQIIIYAGAILVLFLFVIMLLNLKREETAQKYQSQWPISMGIALVFAIFMTMIVGKITVMPALGEYSVEAIKAEGSMMTIGKVLYTRYLLPFEIASLVLLVAIIGAVVLAKQRVE
ncbi:MAG: NADH-quinone oxidoreductase subunit J [Nitrospiraceae bacterium]|nr:MAG: NADH-quinone oxidoreductase subunit J [Nitrospiraceae bacterium]